MTSMTIADVKEDACKWLFDFAAPLWGNIGVLDDGMFAEKLELNATAAKNLNRRVRVQARQIYAYCTLGKMGWTGPWREIVSNALNLLLTKGIREDGQCVHLFDPNGNVIDSRLDLYDHAFVLFALGHAGKIMQRPDALIAAEKMRSVMVQNWQRKEGGFWEGELTPCPPFRQNPHMHMFEAALANFDASGQVAWRHLADSISTLFVGSLWNPEHGAVTEYFDAHWRPLNGRLGEVVEPGHCLEWAWLLEVGFATDEALLVSEKLVNFARTYGIDSEKGIAINEVYLDGSVKDGGARLWPQTERLKAAVTRFKRLNSDFEMQQIIDAYKGLTLYFSTPVKGLWWDRLNKDGTFVEEASPASSFYHIVCALNELSTL